MKLWIDDVRPAPEGYIWIKTVYHAIEHIQTREEDGHPFELIDIDHDAGDFIGAGGDCGERYEQSDMIRTNQSPNGWLCVECHLYFHPEYDCEE